MQLPHTEVAAREVLMLPLFADLSTEQQEYVIERLCRASSGRGPRSAAEAEVGCRVGYCSVGAADQVQLRRSGRLTGARALNVPLAQCVWAGRRRLASRSDEHEESGSRRRLGRRARASAHEHFGGGWLRPRRSCARRARRRGARAGGSSRRRFARTERGPELPQRSGS